MTLLAPRITDINDPLQRAKQTQFMRELLQMAFVLTFLDSDGGTSDGRKAHNFDAVWVAYTSNATANTEDTVAHNLGRTPVGALIGLPDKSATIYDSGTTWTSTNIYLKSSAATTVVNILVF